MALFRKLGVATLTTLKAKLSKVLSRSKQTNTSKKKVKIRKFHRISLKNKDFIEEKSK